MARDEGENNTLDLQKGATTTKTVPTGHRYKINWLRFSYTADATVANRIVRPYLDIGGSMQLYLGYLSVAAGETKTISMGADAPATAGADDDVRWSGDGLIARAGDILNVSITDGQAGDAWRWRGSYKDCLQ